MERITVGLDFGTHQTKICIENKSDVRNPIYSFFAFEDRNGAKSVILPSIIQINKDDTLSYGFVDKSNAKYGRKFINGDTLRMTYRYFKQSTFSDYEWNCELSSTNLSIWYISYILFLLEDEYGKDFAIQMGIPTGANQFEDKKQKAVSILLSAYHIVEDVFQNNLSKFLSTKIHELEKLTTLVPFSYDKKEEYGLLIFPEAYAGLKSLTNQKKIPRGMSLMVDIGGGTTDITFFTIENDRPTIYDYSSIPFGINFIVETAMPNLQDKFDANVDLNKLDKKSFDKAIQLYYHKLSAVCNNLVAKLRFYFERTGFPLYRLNDALKDRIIIYSGGGSTYSKLRHPVMTFSDVLHINPKVWEGMSINEINSHVALCPILSTSLGLSISEINDNVKLTTTEYLFKQNEYRREEEREEDIVRSRWV